MGFRTKHTDSPDCTSRSRSRSCSQVLKGAEDRFVDINPWQQNGDYGS